MKLTPKLTLLFLLLSLVPLALAGYLAYESSRRAIEQNTTSRLVANTIFKKNEFNRWLDSTGIQLRQFAHRPLIKGLAETLVNPNAAAAEFQPAHDVLLYEHFRPTVAGEVGFLELFLLDGRSGQILVSTDPNQESRYRESETYFIEGQKGTFVDNVRYSLSLGQAVMHASTPIKNDDGTVVAVLAGRLDLSIMTEIMNQESGLNPSEKTYLVNSFNFFVTNPKLGGDIALKETAHTPGVQACLAGNSDLGLYNDYRGMPVMGAYRWLPERELCILTEVDQAEAFAPIMRLRNQLLGIGGLIAGIVVTLGVVFSRSITGPVKELVEGTEAVGRGNLDYRINIANRDEIGELATAFNQMTARRRQIENELRQAHDQLEQRVAERTAELQKSEKKYRDLVDYAPVGVYQTTLSGDILYVNDTFVRLLDYDSAEQMYESGTWARYKHRDSREKFIQQLQTDGVVTNFETELVTSTNRTVQVLISGTLNDPFISGMVIDITERKQAHDALRQSEERYRSLFENMLDGYAYCKMLFEPDQPPDFIYIQVNPAFETLTGLKNVAEQRVSQVIPGIQESNPELFEIYERVALTGKPERFDVYLPALEIWLSIAVFSPAKEYFVAVFDNITERKQAEETLRQSEEKYRTLFETMTQGIVHQNAGGAITGANPAAEQILGLTLDQMRGRTSMDPRWRVIRADGSAFPGEAHPATVALKTGEEIRDVLMGVFHPQREEYRWINVNAVPQFNADDGKPYQVHTTFEDITERKQAEDILAQKVEELARSNKELEQFAYVASHDLQEPLRMVTSYLQLLERRYKDKLDADADEFIAFAVDGAIRMKRLIDDLLAYSRVGTQGKELEPINSELVLERVLSNLQLAIEDEQATITHDSLPTVLADSSQLEQLLQNLLSNALKFRSEAPPKIHIGVERQREEWLFSVRDNGIGFENEFAERIFIIFQRLHSSGKYPGTGMGLAICKKIVERHGGRIWVEAEPVLGSIFYFTLPIGEEDFS